MFQQQSCICGDVPQEHFSKLKQEPPSSEETIQPLLKKPKTYTYWFSLLRLVRRPTSLAQAATFLRTVEDFAPTAFIFSCIFSQTRGTPMKAVGRASFKVSTSEPCKKQTNRKIQIKITFSQLTQKEDFDPEEKEEV